LSSDFTFLKLTTTQKPKLKVGKARAKADNFTDTSFKAKCTLLYLARERTRISAGFMEWHISPAPAASKYMCLSILGGLDI